MGLRAPFLMCNEGYKRNNVKHKENSKTAWDARNKTLWVSHLLMFSPSKEQGWWCKQDVGGFVDIYEQVLFSWSQFWSNWHLGDCWALEMLLQSGFGFTLSSEPDLSSSFFYVHCPLRKVLARLCLCRCHSGSLWAQHRVVHGEQHHTGSAGVSETYLEEDGTGRVWEQVPSNPTLR